MKISVKIEGLREVQEALHQLPKSTARSVLRRVLKKRAKPFADTASANVRVLSGRLKSSIRISSKLSRRQKRLHRKPHRDVVELFIGPGPDPASHLQEYGSVRNQANPYMRPAWDRNHAAAFKGIKEDMWAEVRKTVQRVARRKLRAGIKAGRIT